MHTLGIDTFGESDVNTMLLDNHALGFVVVQGEHASLQDLLCIYLQRITQSSGILISLSCSLMVLIRQTGWIVPDCPLSAQSEACSG